MCNLFGFCVGHTLDSEVSARGENVHRMVFPFEVATDVGAQCKFKALPFGRKITSFCSGGKSIALFVLIEFVTSSEC